MKKTFVIGSLLVVILVAAGVVGVALAQSPTPPAPTNPLGRGMHSGGMRGGIGRGGEASGVMHEYMLAELAEAFSLTTEELQAKFDEGKTPWDIAQEQGLTEEQFFALMLAARTAALEKMVADGVITQEQADWMLSRMGSASGGFGPCHGNGAPFGGPSRGNPNGRWQTKPVEPSTSSNG